MADISYFESRQGRLTCTAEDLFSFVTDIRNFEQLVPGGNITNWNAEKDSCSFNVSMLGTVGIRITGKEMNRRVEFTGDALKKEDFSMLLHISGDRPDPAEVKITLMADLNPMLKAMASKPIAGFLDTLIDEMENFNGWKDPAKQNQPL
jgi:carbon monoxide dehydrogenase subunit G